MGACCRICGWNTRQGSRWWRSRCCRRRKRLCEHWVDDLTLPLHWPFIGSAQGGNQHDYPLESADKQCAAVRRASHCWIGGCGSSTPPNVAGKDSSAPAPDPKSVWRRHGGADAGNSSPDTQSLAGHRLRRSRTILLSARRRPFPIPIWTRSRRIPAPRLYWYGTDQFGTTRPARWSTWISVTTWARRGPHEEIHSSVDEGDSRIETVTLDGKVTERHLTRLKDGGTDRGGSFRRVVGRRPAPHCHTTWNYDASRTAGVR